MEEKENFRVERICIWNTSPKLLRGTHQIKLNKIIQKINIKKHYLWLDD